MSFQSVQASGYVKGTRLKIFKAIAFNPNESQRTGCRIADVALNGGTTRYAELEHNGLIEVTGYAKCPVTGKTVGLYAITGHVPTEKLKALPSELKSLRKEVKELRQISETLHASNEKLIISNKGLHRAVKSLAQRVDQLKKVSTSDLEERLAYSRIVDATREKNNQPHLK